MNGNTHRRDLPARVVARLERRRSNAAGTHRTRTPRATERRRAINEQMV